MAATSSAVVVIVVVVGVGVGVVVVAVGVKRFELRSRLPYFGMLRHAGDSFRSTVCLSFHMIPERQTDGRELPLVMTTLAIMIQERVNSTRTYLAPYR